MSLALRAADALAHARTAGRPRAVTAPVRRARARIARHVVAMLGVDPGHVRVLDDPARPHGAMPGHLITVDDPTDPAGGLRLIPETGDEVLFCLLGPCPDCGGEVPLAPIGDLVDLGLHHERWTRALGGDPDDAWPDPLPAEFDLDPGHHADCAIGRR